MKLETKYFIYGIIFGVIIMLILYFYMVFMDFQAVNIFQLKDKCHETLIQTCQTTNSVINLTEKQSKLLEKCYNVTEGTLPRLSYLNCEELMP